MIFGQDTIKLFNSKMRQEELYNKIVQYTQEQLFVSLNVIIIAKQSIFGETINRHLLRLESIGFMDHEMEALVHGGGSSAECVGVQALSMDHVAGVFELYSCMMVVAMVVLMVETGWKRMSVCQHNLHF